MHCSTGTSDLPDRQDHEYLRDEVNRLCKELETVRECAKHHEADAATWRTRYEQLKPQLVNSVDRTARLLETMREQLASSESQGYSSGQTLAQVSVVISIWGRCSFAAAVPDVAPQSTRDRSRRRSRSVKSGVCWHQVTTVVEGIQHRLVLISFVANGASNRHP